MRYTRAKLCSPDNYMDFFKGITQLPSDPILGLTQAFLTDSRPFKVNLGAGVYKTAHLKSFILPSVKKAEALLLEQESTKDYLPIEGFSKYIAETRQLVFSTSSDRIVGVQSVGGTGALRVGADFLRKIGIDRVFISNPTWPNHALIFQQAGFQIGFYPYYDENKRALDFTGLYEAVKQMPENSAILLQASCHNPTGLDLSESQWHALLILLKERSLFPFFDLAYQGFGEGVEEDALIIRLCEQAGLTFGAAVSHSKNFGLYGERVGCLFMVCHDSLEAIKVASHLKVLVRGNYSNPPLHGASLVSLVLQQPNLREMWREELEGMRQRIHTMRTSLVTCLREEGKTCFYDFLQAQKGMFSFTGLKKGEVERLIAEYGIYMTPDGRMNVAGLNPANIPYVAEAILKVGDLPAC